MEFHSFTFFAFLLLFTLALFLQDPILESYGAEVFGMPIAATASLSATWGIGTLAGLLLAGFWIVPRLGKLATARLGCQLILLSHTSNGRLTSPRLKVRQLIFR